MSPRADAAAALPSSTKAAAAASSQAHRFSHRRTGSSASSSAPNPPSAEQEDAAPSVSAAAPVETKQEAAAADDRAPGCDQSDDGSVGTRSTPGPETPRHENPAGDDVRRRSSASSTMSATARRSDFTTSNIPPFRGRHGDTGYGGVSGKNSIIEEQTEKPRRSSGPSVFMIPAPVPPRAASSHGGAYATGLGIEGLADSTASAGAMARTYSSDRVHTEPAPGEARGAAPLKRSLAPGEMDAQPSELRTSAQREVNDTRMSGGRHSVDSSASRRGSSASPNRQQSSPEPRPSKRPRTRLSPLHSLASTASTILTSNAYHTAPTAPPSRGGMSLAALISHPESSAAVVNAGAAGFGSGRPDSASGRAAAEPARMTRASWPGAEADERDDKPRRPSAPTQGSAQSGPSRTEAKGTLPGQGGFAVVPEAEADGLGRRRGHRPPAVSTGAVLTASVCAPAVTAGANGSTTTTSTTTEPPHRQSIGTIPSVLVGGAMEAEYTAQMVARERERELQRHRPRPSSASQRRESFSAGGQLPPSSSTPAAGTLTLPPAPGVASSSSYYARPNPPFAPMTHQHPRASSFSSVESQGPRGSIAAAMPPGPPRHLTSVSVHRIGAEPPPPGPPSHHIIPPTYSMGPPSTYPPAPLHAGHAEPEFDAGVNSKQAFLGPFSTFYDSLNDSRILASTLDGHIQRASALLHTLSSAEAALEALVDQRIDACRTEWDSRWRHVEQRLRWLEERVSHGRTAVEGGVEDRLGRLEETVARRHSDSDYASNAGRRGSGGSVPRVAGRGSAHV